MAVYLPLPWAPPRFWRWAIFLCSEAPKPWVEAAFQSTEMKAQQLFGNAMSFSFRGNETLTNAVSELCVQTVPSLPSVAFDCSLFSSVCINSHLFFSYFLLQERVFLTISNYIFTAIFVAEMTVKVKMSLVFLHFLQSFSSFHLKYLSCTFFFFSTHVSSHCLCIHSFLHMIYSLIHFPFYISISFTSICIPLLPSFSLSLPLLISLKLQLAV